LDSGERFAGPRSELRGNLAYCIQDVFLSCRLYLLLIKDGAGAAILSEQAHHITTSEAGDGSLQQSALPVRSQISPARAGVKRASGGRPMKRSVCWIAHRTQRSGTRLLKLYRQSLSKRAIEDGIACRVPEIGQDDFVLVSESWRLVKIMIAGGQKR